MDIKNFFQTLIGWVLFRGLKVVWILIVAYFTTRLAKILICKLIKPLAKEGSRVKGRVDGKILEQREKTLEGVFISVSNVLIWLIAILMILPEFELNTIPILAGSGLVGLAIGMGSRSLIQDYLSGLFTLIEDQYRVGEEIKVVGIKGKVKDLNLRRTILEDSEGVIHYIPNGQIIRVSNFSRSNKKELGSEKK